MGRCLALAVTPVWTPIGRAITLQYRSGPILVAASSNEVSCNKHTCLAGDLPMLITETTYQLAKGALSVFTPCHFSVTCGSQCSSTVA
jgi:hypothetical protein